MAVTMQDVARRVGVSAKTVSNVLNDRPSVSAETRQRVLLAVEHLGYRMNHAARTLKSGKSGAISLVIPDIRNAYFTELSAAVIAAAEDRQIAVIIEQSYGDRNQELSLLRGHRAITVDGVLYYPTRLVPEDAEFLVDLPVPVVLLGERIFGGPLDHVTMQNAEGAKAATGHLLELGRRRIVAFGAPRCEETGSAGLRLQGYRSALATAGIAFDPALVAEAPYSSWNRWGGVEGMRTFLARNVPFDGVVAFNDLLALGAMKAMQDAGLDIPRDVALIGFDNIEEAQYARPALSTIEPGKHDIARTAFAFLAERMDQGASQVGPREHFTTYSLKARASTMG
jgi:DNA-binding LacI/PurR family transcriptional regulator